MGWGTWLVQMVMLLSKRSLRWPNIGPAIDWQSAWRASSGCLIGRIEKVGESNRMAAKRRAWALKESDRHRQERKSHWTAHVQGRGVIRGEFIYTIWLNLQTCCWTWCQIFRLSIGLRVLFSLIGCYNIWMFKLGRRTFVRTIETQAEIGLS